MIMSPDRLQFIYNLAKGAEGGIRLLHAKGLTSYYKEVEAAMDQGTWELVHSERSPDMIDGNTALLVLMIQKLADTLGWGLRDH